MSDNFTFDDTYKMLFFGMAVYIVCLVIRRGLEFFLGSLKSDSNPYGRVWQEFVLPTLPVLLGGVAGALIKTFPYPEGFSSRPMHAVYGLVCGFGAGWAYRILKATAEKKWQVQLPGEVDDKLGMLSLQKLTPDQLLEVQQNVGKALLAIKPPEA